MKPLDLYKQLLDQHDAAISRPDWDEVRPTLVATMDRVWRQLSGTGGEDDKPHIPLTLEKLAAVQYAGELYQRRIGR